MLLNEEDLVILRERCKSFKIKKLYLFDSALSDNYNTESDIDLIVDFRDYEPLNYFDNYYNLKNFLISHFNRKIDLLESRSISNSNFMNEIYKNKYLVYEYQN